MAEGSWRKLNVDQYDDDRVLATDLYVPDARSPAQQLADQQQKQQTVRGLLQRGDAAASLKAGLLDPPFGEEESEPAKVSPALGVTLALSVVASILNSTKSTDIPALVADLDPVEQVTLMKYIYKVMENLGEANGNVALGWHEKLVEHAGVGCIVRVMTDHRRV
ncbi:hypothetical protein RQP46_007615 [Phenoliferia psychrophenolica]